MLEPGHMLGQPCTIQRHQHRLNVQLYEGFQVRGHLHIVRFRSLPRQGTM